MEHEYYLPYFNTENKYRILDMIKSEHESLGKVNPEHFKKFKRYVELILLKIPEEALSYLKLSIIDFKSDTVNPSFYFRLVYTCERGYSISLIFNFMVYANSSVYKRAVFNIYGLKNKYLGLRPGPDNVEFIKKKDKFLNSYQNI